jgi:late competence protein required for DNA uptake (superfamily II DNA/RNA helicase)
MPNSEADSVANSAAVNQERYLVAMEATQNRKKESKLNRSNARFAKTAFVKHQCSMPEAILVRSINQSNPCLKKKKINNALQKRN